MRNPNWLTEKSRYGVNRHWFRVSDDCVFLGGATHYGRGVCDENTGAITSYDFEGGPMVYVGQHTPFGHREVGKIVPVTSIDGYAMLILTLDPR